MPTKTRPRSVDGRAWNGTAINASIVGILSITRSSEANLGIAWDGDTVYQSTHVARHRDAAEQLLAAGKAYPCYCTPLELEMTRKSQLAAGRPPRYAGTCATLDAAGRAARSLEGRVPSLRFRVPPYEVTVFNDGRAIIKGTRDPAVALPTTASPSAPSPCIGES